MALDLGSVVLSGIVAAGSSVLTNWLTPRFGHAMWKRQRQQELRLDTIAALVTVTSEFYQQWIAADSERWKKYKEAERGDTDVKTLESLRKTINWKPSMDWYIRKHSMDCKIRALFSPAAHEEYRELEKRFSPELGAIDVANQSEFEQAYSKAFNRLYAEVFGGKAP
jgi:hypothetical protein